MKQSTTASTFDAKDGNHRHSSLHFVIVPLLGASIFVRRSSS